MAIDKYSQLKIASAVLGVTIQDMANDLNVTPQSVKGVCNGTIKSEKIENYVNAKIKEAEKAWDAHRSRKKKSTDSATAKASI